MKLIERIPDSLIRQVVTIDESQFEFVPGRSTIDAGEVSYCRQTDLFRFCRPRKDINPSSSEK